MVAISRGCWTDALSRVVGRMHYIGVFDWKR